MERNGIKIGFLGYCDHVPDYPNCTAMRRLYKSGPAIYRDDIATRDVNKLKKVERKYNVSLSVLICFVMSRPCTLQGHCPDVYLLKTVINARNGP